MTPYLSRPCRTRTGLGQSRPNHSRDRVESSTKVRSTKVEAGLEFATLEWVDWFNNRWLLEPIGNTLPTEAESRYCAQSAELAKVA